MTPGGNPHSSIHLLASQDWGVGQRMSHFDEENQILPSEVPFHYFSGQLCSQLPQQEQFSC